MSNKYPIKIPVTLALEEIDYCSNQADAMAIFWEKTVEENIPIYIIGESLLSVSLADINNWHKENSGTGDDYSPDHELAEFICSEDLIIELEEAGYPEMDGNSGINIPVKYVKYNEERRRVLFAHRLHEDVLENDYHRCSHEVLYIKGSDFDRLRQQIGSSSNKTTDETARKKADALKVDTIRVEAFKKWLIEKSGVDTPYRTGLPDRFYNNCYEICCTKMGKLTRDKIIEKLRKYDPVNFNNDVGRFKPLIGTVVTLRRGRPPGSGR